MTKSRSESESSQSHDGEDLLIQTIGSIGRYQLLLYVVTGYAVFIHGWQMVVNKFLTYPVPFQCQTEATASLLQPGDQCLELDNVTKCQSFTYHSDAYENTATARFDLVCDRAFYNRIAQFLFFFGSFVGVFVGGIMVDKVGRLVAFRFWLALWIVASITEAFVIHFWLWVLLRFVAGGCSIAINTCQTVYCVEFAGQKWRTFTNTYFS